METFKAFRIHEVDGRIVARFEEIALDQLAAGEVVVRVRYSTIDRPAPSPWNASCTRVGGPSDHLLSRRPGRLQPCPELREIRHF